MKKRFRLRPPVFRLRLDSSERFGWEGTWARHEAFHEAFEEFARQQELRR